MFKHPRPLKRQPQLRSTSPALDLVSAPLASVPLLLRPFGVFAPLASDSGLSLSVFTAPSTSSPLYIPHVFTLAFSGKPLWRAHCQYLCCGEHSLHFFVQPTLPRHFIILISLPSSSFILPDVFLLCFSSPLFHCSELATSRQRIEEEDQEIESKTGKRVIMERRDQ